MWPWSVIHLARHGQTEWNVQRRRQGQLDSPLTPAGLECAHAHAEQLAGRGIEVVFSSPLGRARSTAAVLSDHLRVPVVVLDELAEVHHGEFAGMTDEEVERSHPGAWDERSADRYRWRFLGGESYADAADRAGRALTEVADHGADRPLVVAHEMINRMLLGHLLRLTPEQAMGRTHPHEVVYAVSGSVQAAEPVVLRAGRGGV